MVNATIKEYGENDVSMNPELGGKSMDKPYFLLSSSSGKSQFFIDRRIQKDKDTKAMRERLTSSGCTQEEYTQEERDALVASQKGEWI